MVTQRGQATCTRPRAQAQPSEQRRSRTSKQRLWCGPFMQEVCKGCLLLIITPFSPSDMLQWFCSRPTREVSRACVCVCVGNWPLGLVSPARGTLAWPLQRVPGPLIPSKDSSQLIFSAHTLLTLIHCLMGTFGFLIQFLDIQINYSTLTLIAL